MLPTVFKVSKSIDFDKLMKTYILKNYDMTSYTQEVQSFISQFQQTRNVLILLNEKDKTYDSMKSNKDVLVEYLMMLNVIKSKMNFGKDDFSIKVEFGWKDVIKNDFWYSYNINHEYYSNMFNLGVMLYNLGISIPFTEEEAKLKEAVKALQNSAWIFDNIKTELPSVIPVKETPPDMTQNYLSYCSYICLAQAQCYLLTVADKKKASFELQGQLSKGIFDLFNSALQLANDSLKKIINDETKTFLNNRRFWYAALSFIKMKDQLLEEFGKTGEGYGKAIAYLGLACDSLNNGYKDIKKIKNMIDVKFYEDFKTAQENLGQEMLEKNSRIYFQAVPELTTLPKLDKKIMVSSQQIPDNLNAQLEGGNSVLDALVPREVKGMIENYKRQMMEYISENLNSYQNEAEIMTFLNELNLPYSLETVLSQNEISESLWRKISEVQQKGGTMFLTTSITNLDKKGEEIARRINDLMITLTNEEDEDTKYRNQYGNRWTRNSSKQLNYQYLSVLQEYSKKLEIARNCDAQVKQGIMDNMKFLEFLTLTKQSLSNKIPVKTDPNSIKNCEEANSLRKDLDGMDVLKDKCMELINKIFQTLNEDNNIIPQFIQVLQKKTTEKSILTDNKSKYDALFKELGAISEEIKLMKLSIKAKNEVFIRVKQENFRTNDDNEKFFRDLEDYCQMYNQKLVNLQQGMNFYTEFNRRLNEINSHIADYLMSRDIEKNEMIRMITSGGNNMGNTGNQPKNTPSSNNQFFGESNNNYWDFTNTNTNKNYLNQSAYLDPSRCLITNMNAGSGNRNNNTNFNNNTNNLNNNTNYNNTNYNNSNMININPGNNNLNSNFQNMNLNSENRNNQNYNYNNSNYNNNYNNNNYNNNNYNNNNYNYK